MTELILRKPAGYNRSITRSGLSTAIDIVMVLCDNGCIISADDYNNARSQRKWRRRAHL